MAFTLAYNVDDIAKRSSSNCMFDTDVSFVVCNNSANTHICNDKSMYAEFKETSRGMVATIGGKLNSPAGIGTVKWKSKDDAGLVHEILLDKVLYFPNSPINIMSITEFARQLDDEERTGIDKKMKYSRFYWDDKKYSRKNLC